MKRSAFTMIELVFVIVVLGILASIALPKLAVTRTDAQITKYTADIATIRSAIATTRSQNLLKGIPDFPELEGADNDMLFDNVLDYPIKISDGKTGWKNGDGKEYTLSIDGSDIVFTYDDTGRFTCDTNGSLCKQLTQ
jgi:general secretion pathway protein G